jgi:Fibronectin type III domain
MSVMVMPRTSRSRRASLFAALLLLTSGLAAVAAQPPAQAESFAPHPCVDSSTPRPCLESATLNGDPLPSGLEIDSVGKADDGFGNTYFQFLLAGDTDMIKALTKADSLQTMWDMGTMSPDYTEAFAYRPDVDRINDGDGTYHLRYTGSPILVTSGCNESAAWPLPCPSVSDADSVQFEVDVYQRADNEFVGFDRAQSPQSVNGIFLEKAADGSEYLSSEMVNSGYLSDGTTPFKGDVRFRIPYHMLRSDFDIPDPETMVPASLVGQVNAKKAIFDIQQDPDGGGVIVDISNLDFRASATPRGTTNVASADARANHRINRVIKVKRGTIRPTKPKITAAKRASATKAKLTFTRAKPRGAKVHGYTARCVAKGSTRVVDGKYPTVVVRHLKAGKHYTCQVRARSKAGPGRYSAGAKV